MHTATGLSLRQTVVRAREQGIADISDVALLKRLRLSEPWLRRLTAQMTEMGDHDLVQRLAQRRRIRVVDATTVEEQGGAGTDWRVHYTLCLPDLSCDFFEVTDEHGGETYRRIPVERGDLILGDRGYSNAAGVSAMLAAGGDVLVRWNSFSFPLETAEGSAFEALKELSKLPKRGVREWAVAFTHQDQRYTGRLCVIRKSAVATVRAQEKMQKQARKEQKQPSEEALKLAAFIAVFTPSVRKCSAPRKSWNYTGSAGRSSFVSNISRAYWDWVACPNTMNDRVGPGFRPSSSAGHVASLGHVAGPYTLAALARSLRRLGEALAAVGRAEEGKRTAAEAENIWCELGLPEALLHQRDGHGVPAGQDAGVDPALRRFALRVEDAVPARVAHAAADDGDRLPAIASARRRLGSCGQGLFRCAGLY